MPIFGLGTWLSSNNGECEAAVKCALESGYRLIDTAQMYGNEGDCGKSIAAFMSSHPNAQMPFIVSKLKGDAHEKGNVRRSLKRSLQLLQLDSIDLFLVHSPRGGRCVDTWKEMLQCRDEGLAKAVGVSNFGVAQLQGLETAGLELPEVNQIELHVWNQQKTVLQYMRDKQIAAMGYCPLARCKRFGDTGLSDLAAARGCHEASLAIRWSLEQGIITIPKSSNPERIASNAQVLDVDPFSPEELEVLAALNEGFCASNSVKSMDLPWEDVM